MKPFYEPPYARLPLCWLSPSRYNPMEWRLLVVRKPDVWHLVST